MLTNLASIQEDVGLIPDLAHQVKDPVLPSAEVQVADVAQILHCCGCGVGRQLQLQFDPQPGNFHFHFHLGYSPKKQYKNVFLIKVYLTYYVMPILALQQSDSDVYIYIHIRFYILFHPGLSQETGQSSLCCAVGPGSQSYLNKTGRK